MIAMNPLASGATILAASRAARLYVLTRDAYLASPAQTRSKLEALEELRRVTTAGAPGDAARVGGVRLVEMLRVTMHTLAAGTDEGARRLALLDVLTATRPAGAGGWTADPRLFLVDAGRHLLPEVEGAQLARLVRRHRTTGVLLQRVSGSRMTGRPHLDEPDPAVAAVADMIAGVLGLTPSAALAQAVLTVQGPGLDETRGGVAGGLVLDPTDDENGGMLGTDLALQSVRALADQLAGLDTVAAFRPDLRQPLAARVRDLREDLVAREPLDDRDAARLGAGRRVVEYTARRLDPSPWSWLARRPARRFTPPVERVRLVAPRFP